MGVCRNPFMFATGIENSYPVVKDKDGRRLRFDQMAASDHYRRWREDFDLLRDMGLKFLRYGPPYFSAHVGPGRYDWSFADEVFAAMREQGIVPIADLCHFGVPDWVGDFQNPDWPVHFGEYARAFAHRYPWVSMYTPVNEIYVTALFSAQYGWWNEMRSDDASFVTALKNLCRANVLAMHGICKEITFPAFIQSESTEYYHSESPDCTALANFLNEKRFLSLDFSYGHPLSAEMYQYVADNGMTRDEYAWFRENHVKGLCIMGNDYYVTNEHMVLPDGGTIASGEIFGYYVITKQYYDRYHLPVMHTETNVMDALAGPHWLRKEWANMYRLKQDGVPIIGFTWYSLTDQVDWDSAMRIQAGHVNPVGLFDLNRKPHPVGEAFRKLISQWRDILPMESSPPLLA